MTDLQGQVTSTDRVRKTVLVVEDDQEIGESFIEVLRLESPYEALLVPDSFQALEIMQSITPHLILTDYSLPGMNGIEFYDYLKSIKAFADIPVLLVSARLPMEETLQRKLPYLWKPIDIQELLNTIQKLLS